MTDIAELKRRIRRKAKLNLQFSADRIAASRRIFAKVESLPEYRVAQTVMYYVAMPVEVQTQDAMIAARHAGKNVVVPYCSAGDLALFRWENMDELEPGTWGILEPRRELRSVPEKQVHVTELDLIIVPGLAFDGLGGRVGHGKGYYDRLLARTEPNTAWIGVAYECQRFDQVPMSEHDVRMDRVVTNMGIYGGPLRYNPYGGRRSPYSRAVRRRHGGGDVVDGRDDRTD